jgi:hypothetical protein
MIFLVIFDRLKWTRGLAFAIVTFASHCNLPGGLWIFWPGRLSPGKCRNPFPYRNDGNFQFSQITSGALVNSTGHRGATDTDFHGDGDVDIFMGCPPYTSSLEPILPLDS